MGELDNIHINNHWHNNNTHYPEHTKRGDKLLPYFWCEDNGIIIGPQYHFKDGESKWKIQIKIGDKIHLDPNTYQKKDIMDKIYEYADYYYNKYKV